MADDNNETTPTKKLNKAGDVRGTKENNKQNFANDPKKAAAAAKKGSNAKRSLTANLQAPLVGKQHRVTPETQKFIREEMFAQDASGVPYIHTYIKNFLNEAKTNPNSQAARYLANAVFKEDLLTTLDAEVNKQMAKDAEFTIYRIRNTLYDKQKEVFDDRLSKTIECICTRRAGKTELVARLLVAECVKPPYETPVGKQLERNALYLNRTFDNAVGQMGKPVTDILDSLDIKYHGNPGSGKITLDNGTTITFGGYNNKGDIDKFRGYHYSLVALDEISHLRNPSVLMKETLEPALKDYGHDGRMIMTGTPPRTKVNYAYQLWHNPNIKHYHWSFMDNPFIPEKEQIIADVCKEHGVDETAPFIQREYFGNMEAFDTDAMIFRGYKKLPILPNQTYDYAYIGVDWGYEDKAAVVSVLVKGKQSYIIKSWAESKKSISEIIEVVQEHLINIKNNYKVARTPWVICDTNEKSAVYEMYQTYKINNVYCAYKYDKDMAIEQLAEWLRNDTMFVIDKDNEAILSDLENMLWKRDEETDAITHEVDDEEYHGNAAFALLYASRQFAFDALGLKETNKSAKSILENRQ